MNQEGRCRRQKLPEWQFEMALGMRQKVKTTPIIYRCRKTKTNGFFAVGMV